MSECGCRRPQGIVQNLQIYRNYDISTPGPKGMWQNRKSERDSHIISCESKYGLYSCNIGITLKLNGKENSQVQP